MQWTVDWDGDFVVGGDDGRRLTPNFKLREFRQKDGSVRVHRDLVSALQLLRNRFARPISIEATSPDGLGADIGGRPIEALEKTAEELEAHQLFENVERNGDVIAVRLTDPAQPSELGLEQVLETAFSVTAGFETSGDRFQQVTGNFDGAGISFGPTQVNFLSNTLQPLFREFQKKDAAALESCFSDPDDWREWNKVMELSSKDQIAWGNSISTGSRNQDVAEPWKSYFRAVGRVEAFRAIMVERALRDYGGKLLDAAAYLQSLAPIQIDHLRCICSLYDLVIQQGSLNKAHAQIEARVQKEKPKTQFELVRIAVEERGKRASQAWRADCISRRVGLLQGVPTTIEESGKQAQRANINFYLLRDARLKGAAELMKADNSAELTRVSQVLAQGGTLLA